MICWPEQKHSSVFIFKSIEAILWCQKVRVEQLGQIFAADSLRAFFFQLYLYFSCKKQSGEINAKGFKNTGNKWNSQGTAGSYLNRKKKEKEKGTRKRVAEWFLGKVPGV